MEYKYSVVVNILAPTDTLGKRLKVISQYGKETHARACGFTQKEQIEKIVIDHCRKHQINFKNIYYSDTADGYIVLVD